LQTDEACNVVMPENYACIGEGKYLARASLIPRRLQSITLLHTAVYCVYEAKKSAERVNSVGGGTLVTILHKDGKDFTIRPPKLVELDKLYAMYGPKDVPKYLNLPEDTFERR